jgi:hypothetical protein
MKRFNELVREIRDQAALASGGSFDRPTSFNQSGGLEQRAPARRPAEEPMMDQATARRRPTVAPTRAAVTPRTVALRTMLANSQSLRTAIVIGEVLGPPVSMRSAEHGLDFRPSGEREATGR